MPVYTLHVLTELIVFVLAPLLFLSLILSKTFTVSHFGRIQLKKMSVKNAVLNT